MEEIEGKLLWLILENLSMKKLHVFVPKFTLVNENNVFLNEKGTVICDTEQALNVGNIVYFEGHGLGKDLIKARIMKKSHNLYFMQRKLDELMGRRKMKKKEIKKEIQENENATKIEENPIHLDINIKKEPGIDVPLLKPKVEPNFDKSVFLMSTTADPVPIEKEVNVQVKKVDKSVENNELRTLIASMQDKINNMVKKLDSLSEKTNKSNKRNADELSHNDDDDDIDIYGRSKKKTDDVFVIGPNETSIQRSVFAKLNWNTFTSATRGLLSATFTREDLALNSLTGSPSPAFVKGNKKGKGLLNPKITDDIVDFITKKYGVTVSEVRHSISIKCCDVNRHWRKNEILKAKRDAAAIS